MNTDDKSKKPPEKDGKDGKVSIIIDKKQHFAPSSEMLGAELKKLGGVAPAFECSRMFPAKAMT